MRKNHPVQKFLELKNIQILFKKKNRTTTRQPNVEDNLDSPKVKCIGKKLKQCVSVKEDIANFPKKSNNKTSVQMNMFLDRRVNAEVFLKSLEKKR